MLLVELVASIPEGEDVADTFIATCHLVINRLCALFSIATELSISCIHDEL